MNGQKRKITNMNYRLSLIVTVFFLAACSTNDQAGYSSQSQSQYKDTTLADDDKDGVINVRDFCLKTEQGTSIDNDGCGTYTKEKNSHNLHILFDNNSAEVRPIYLSQIRSMADFLVRYPDTSLELQGYTNHLGSYSHNLELSKRRASNVKKILTRYGIDLGRISIVGFGESKTTHSEDSSQDRKVTATVIGTKKNLDKEWTIFSKLAY